MQRKTSNLLPILAALALIGVIAYAVSTQISLQNNGTIVGLTAYDVPTGGAPITSIEWGAIPPGDSEQTIYIESALEEEITLEISYDNLDSTLIIVYTPEILTIAADAQSRLAVTFTLTVPDDTGTLETLDFQTIIDIVET